MLSDSWKPYPSHLHFLFYPCLTLCSVWKQARAGTLLGHVFAVFVQECPDPYSSALGEQHWSKRWQPRACLWNMRRVCPLMESVVGRIAIALTWHCACGGAGLPREPGYAGGSLSWPNQMRPLRRAHRVPLEGFSCPFMCPFGPWASQA